MAISPQYSKRWRVVPIDDNWLMITWLTEEQEDQMTMENLSWDVLGMVYKTNEAIATHICDLHNKWVDEWEANLPYADEVPPNFCGNTRLREAD